MNTGPTSERVYEAIRRRLLSRAYLPGERLDPAELADELSSSITPVRDALHLLAGKLLVVTGTSEGFRIPHLDEPALKDLYRWNLEILLLALRARTTARAESVSSADAVLGRPGQRWSAPADPWSGADQADGAAACFLAVARRSANAEHERAITATNDRLHAVRTIEPAVLGRSAHGGELELNDFETLAPRDLRRKLAAYHSVRIRNAAALVRAAYRR